MISTAYLHEHDVLDTFLEETYHLMNDVYDARNTLIAAENYIDEQVFMGESASDYQVMLEETKKNVFAKIGDTVIEVFKKLGEFLRKVASDIKGSVSGMKKHMSKSDKALKEQMEKDPELAQKFINSVMNGNIKVHDVKDMDDLLNTARELTDKLASGKIDEKQYMDKIDEKLEKHAKRARNITAILGITTAVSGAVIAIKKLSGESSKVQMESIRYNEELNALKETAMREANKEAGGNSNFLSVWLRGQQKISAALSTDLHGWRAITSKAEGWLSDRLSKINTGYNRKNNDDPLNRLEARKTKDREEEERKERSRQKISDEFRQQQEKRAADLRRWEKEEERDYQNRRYWHDVRKAGDTSYNQQMNRRYADADYERAHPSARKDDK